MTANSPRQLTILHFNDMQVAEDTVPLDRPRCSHLCLRHCLCRAAAGAVPPRCSTSLQWACWLPANLNSDHFLRRCSNCLPFCLQL